MNPAETKREKREAAKRSVTNNDAAVREHVRIE